jgi:hypothetical protein
VAAVLHKDYSTKVHQEWRRAKYRRLARALDLADQRRAGTGSGPPPPPRSGGSI